MGLYDDFNYDQVDLMLVDADRNSRDSLKNVLHNNGFRNLFFGEKIEDIEEQFRIKMPDLMIIDTELPDGDFAELVADLRHHRLGKNPFLPVIATTWNPTPELVRAVIGSGADDLISKPISTAQVLNRIKGLVKARKPFVVTSEYIGPDRRPREVREAEPEVKRMEVPNTLKAKATGKQNDILAAQAAIDEAIREVNDQKIERHADHIGEIVGKIHPALEAGAMNKAIHDEIAKLLFVAEDTGRRMVGTKYAHVSGLCDSLIKVTNDILRAGAKPAAKDIKLLPPLSQAIRAAFADADATEAAALEIAQELGGKS